MKKLVKFRLGLAVIELAFCITLLAMEKGITRKHPYFGVTEVVTYGGFTLLLTARIISTLMLEILPNDIDLVYTRTGMVLYTVSAWVQVVERKDLDRAGLGFGGALIFLFDQTVFFLNHPVPEEYLDTPPPERDHAEEKQGREVAEKEALRKEDSSKPLLQEDSSCYKRTVVS